MVEALDHINVRVSDCARSARFYHGLFGGDLLFIENIPPNPSTPATESWYVGLGAQFLSITPTFPQLGLGVDLDHISLFVRGLQSGDATAAAIKARGLDTLPDSTGWLRDPDRMLYQLRDSASNKPGMPAPPLFSMTVKTKAADIPTPPFTPTAIREITLRVADLSRTTDFFSSAFSGEMQASGSRAERRFRFGSGEVRLIPRPQAARSTRVSMDHITIAVKDFSAPSARRLLRERGIEPRDDSSGGLGFADPDGLQVRLI
jgi:catechol 2,3-dioxygenase-like lactoylglutathione lyase family enzyme